MDANARPQVITALDALAIAPENSPPDAGVYLGLRSIFWELVRAKKARRRAARRGDRGCGRMAVDIEDGNMSDAQDALRNSPENSTAAGARLAAPADDEIKQLDGQAARSDGALHAGALAQQLKNNQPGWRGRSTPHAQVMTASATCRTCSIGWRTWRAAATRTNGAGVAAAAYSADDGKPADGVAGHERRTMSAEQSELDALGDMIRQQQDLRDRTFKARAKTKTRTKTRIRIRISRARSAASRASPGPSQRIPAIRSTSCSRTSRRCATGSTSCSTI